jgi:hypothetical protein
LYRHQRLCGGRAQLGHSDFRCLRCSVCRIWWSDRDVRLGMKTWGRDLCLSWPFYIRKYLNLAVSPPDGVGCYICFWSSTRDGGAREMWFRNLLNCVLAIRALNSWFRELKF